MAFICENAKSDVAEKTQIRFYVYVNDGEA